MRKEIKSEWLSSDGLLVSLETAGRGRYWVVVEQDGLRVEAGFSRNRRRAEKLWTSFLNHQKALTAWGKGLY